MTTIKISNLQLAGSELLTDEESFLNELVDKQESMIYGGYDDVPFCPVGPKPIIHSKPFSPYCAPIRITH